jgi:hypothetical protein
MRGGAGEAKSEDCEQGEWEEAGGGVGGTEVVQGPSDRAGQGVHHRRRNFL